ncbi:MAG: hypothetical protein AB1646_22130 [Thermodesulfobacteriota bacterium]
MAGTETKKSEANDSQAKPVTAVPPEPEAPPFKWVTKGATGNGIEPVIKKDRDE